MNGTIRKLKDGFGFVAGADGIDCFFHWQMLSKFTIQFRYLKEGMEVTFEPEYTDRGPRAQNIKVKGHTIDIDSMRSKFVSAENPTISEKTLDEIPEISSGS